MKLFHGNNLETLKTLQENSIDSIVTDPPYGLSFMNKKWDHSVPSVEFWQECFRVLKPGGHVLSFGGTRTYHRMAVNIEDAGFEIRDQIMWLYGSGFPKSQNVSKMIDKKFGCEREVVGVDLVKAAKRPTKNEKQWNQYASTKYDNNITKPASDLAKQWDGFGTALKPAFEPLVVAMKPLTTKDLLTSLVRECQLLLFAEIAKTLLKFNLSEETQQYIAQWSVGKNTLTQDALSEVTAMLQSELEASLSLSTEFSWLNTLEEIYQNVSTFTTEMESSLTIDLKTLSYLLSNNMQENTTQDEQLGEKSNASLVQNLLCAVELKLKITQTFFAQDHVTKSDDLKNLHPNSEPIVLARKPLSEKTIVDNVLKWGTGAINIDGCRIKAKSEKDLKEIQSSRPSKTSNANEYSLNHGGLEGLDRSDRSHVTGRWPANIILDEQAAFVLDEQSGRNIRMSSCVGIKKETQHSFLVGDAKDQKGQTISATDKGGASRFFYVVKEEEHDKSLQCQSDQLLKTANLVGQNLSLEDQLLNSVQEAVKIVCKKDHRLHQCLDSMQDSKKCILYQDLVSLVDCPQNIGITEITQSLLRLFGSVHLVTEESIKQENQRKKSDPTRFIYQAKASKSERNRGLEGMPLVQSKTMGERKPDKSGNSNNTTGQVPAKNQNHHPTVKPIKLMEYLVKLITPPSGVVLDPFMGSGSTGVACKNLGFDFVGMELDQEYFKIAEKRINGAQPEQQLGLNV